ncbi:hypothetical protein CI102_5039 [Trichoderma harzianum]|jgi:hypothetical protein|uniref:Uncharacterized protein n=1 Tax=Trichoderma harzianum CBS 226.95 TaxID=983964 RepID=A0A2T4AV83_TRIHA|nr:hypothetical protein M431DRAFT_200718 [Trichoderma harzianum CBS 226.95]PKK51507.1 hypothetical protein CI102_5039 [Trichoderma harzianum]PTB60951.1 hypothetical protein M431DRAFT_200718 [Trichoderma harzianum CBS 226.95]
MEAQIVLLPCLLGTLVVTRRALTHSIAESNLLCYAAGRKKQLHSFSLGCLFFSSLLLEADWGLISFRRGHGNARAVLGGAFAPKQPITRASGGEIKPNRLIDVSKVDHRRCHTLANATLWRHQHPTEGCLRCKELTSVNPSLH